MTNIGKYATIHTAMTKLESLYNVAEQDGIAICEYPLPNNVSVSVRIDGECYIGLDKSKIETTAQETVHLAHELGHCETLSFYNPYSPLDQRGWNEYRADRWAIENLCPPNQFRIAYRSGAFTSVFVIAFKPYTVDSQVGEIMDRIFNFLDNYPIDWQYSLFLYSTTPT